MSAEGIEHRSTLEFWVTEAQDILEIIQCNHDKISASLEIAVKLRDFYSQGKKDGVYISDNAQR